MKLFAQLFDFAVEDSPEDCQMELIELQVDMNTKRKYSENSLVDFYKLCVKSFPVCRVIQEEWPHLFGSTYCSEQFFSKMKVTKTRCSSQLTEEHLTCQLRVATTSVKADIDKLCRDSKFQVSY